MRVFSYSPAFWFLLISEIWKFLNFYLQEQSVFQSRMQLFITYATFSASPTDAFIKNTIPVVAYDLGAVGYNTAANDERNKGAFVMGAGATDIDTLLSRSQSLVQSKGKGGGK